jgi:hypothetical protein
MQSLFLKFKMVHLVQKTHKAFIEPERAMFCSLEPAREPYPRLDESSLHSYILFI